MGLHLRNQEAVRVSRGNARGMMGPLREGMSEMLELHATINRAFSESRISLYWDQAGSSGLAY